MHGNVGSGHAFLVLLGQKALVQGAFTETVNGDLTQGGYWFRWKKEYAARAERPLADAFLHAANDLGPLAVQMGLADQYAGEYPGVVKADLLYVLNGEALERLFDSEQTTDRILWSSLGKI